MPQPTDSAHNRWWEISEVVFGVPVLASIPLQLALPFTLPGGLFTPIFILAGAALFTAGVILIILARREFTRFSQRTDPGHATTRIVTTGVFSISRNPLYLGCVFALLGIALAVNLPALLILTPLALVACHYILIAPEERYLTVKFGEEYIHYTATVHRWLGRARTTLG